MPIINISAIPTIKRLGILRKGDEKTNPKKPGKDLDHLRFTSDDAKMLTLMDLAYGSEVNRVRFYLPFQTLRENFDPYREEWKHNKLVHRCDGETCYQGGKPTGEPCPGGCKPTGRLNIVVDVAGMKHGIVTVLTTSIHDVSHITQRLLGVQQAYGKLKGIPLILSREPRLVNTTIDGKKAKKTFSLLEIQVDPEWEGLMGMDSSMLADPAEVESESFFDVFDDDPDLDDEHGLSQPEPDSYDSRYADPKFREQCISKARKLAKELSQYGHEYDELLFTDFDELETATIVELGKSWAIAIKQESLAYEA